MKYLVKGFTLVAAGLAGLSACANAQTASSVVLNGLGSSGIFLELGKAAAAAAPAGLGATCLFTSTTNVTASDTSTGSALTDTGNAWIAWTPGTAGNNTTCGTTSSSTKIYALSPDRLGRRQPLLVQRNFRHLLHLECHRRFANHSKSHLSHRHHHRQH